MRPAEDPQSTPRPFDSRLDLQATANEQGVEPAEDFDALLGDIWSGDEFAEGIIDRARKLSVYLLSSTHPDGKNKLRL